jgi:hypothetical protein
MLNDCQDSSCRLTPTRTGSDLIENPKYEVVVGSLGTVYRGNSCLKASMEFLNFIEYAKGAQDVVAFFENNEIKRHFVGLKGTRAIRRSTRDARFG